MYEFMLENKTATFILAVAAAWLASFAAGNSRQALRLIAFGYGPSFACAFFLVGFAYPGTVSNFDLLAGGLFEFVVLVAYARLFHEAVTYSKSLDSPEVEQWLKASIALQLLIAIPLATTDGFGIFSDGTRIAYLDDSAGAKLLTYAVAPIAAVQAGLIARRLSTVRSPGLAGYSAILITFVLSTLSGSKGGVFLWLLSILALTNFRHIRLRWKPVSVWLLAVTAALSLTVKMGAETLNISYSEFGELAVARFFLNNDARAFALDFGGAVGSHSELLAASFRAISTRLGHPPTDPPLGLILYEHYFGVLTGNGPNASLIALIIYYSLRGYALLPVLVASLGVGIVYLAVLAARRAVRGAMRKMSVTLIGTLLIHQLSQDFLAFPLILIVAWAAVFIFIFTDRRRTSASFKEQRCNKRFANTKYHHTGA